MSKKSKTLIILAITVVCSVYWAGHSPTIENWRTNSAIQDFSGDYYMGFSWFWHLSINADSTFTLEAFDHTSSQLQYAGNVVVENYRFRLVTSDKDFNEPSVFIPVKWGQRKYIINIDSVDSFCNYISQGWEPRDWETGGPFYLKENHWEKPAGLIPISLNGFPLCMVSSLFGQQ